MSDLKRLALVVLARTFSDNDVRRLKVSSHWLANAPNGPSRRGERGGGGGPAEERGESRAGQAGQNPQERLVPAWPKAAPGLPRHFAC